MATRGRPRKNQFKDAESAFVLEEESTGQGSLLVKFDLQDLGEDDLYLLHAEIEALLPAKHLKDMSLEREMVVQLRRMQALQTAVMADRGTPANQRAQTANAVASILKDLGQLQQALYTSERLKDIEKALAKAIKTLPMETQKQFIEEYKGSLEEL